MPSDGAGISPFSNIDAVVHVDIVYFVAARHALVDPDRDKLDFIGQSFVARYHVLHLADCLQDRCVIHAHRPTDVGIGFCRQLAAQEHRHLAGINQRCQPPVRQELDLLDAVELPSFLKDVLDCRMFARDQIWLEWRRWF